MKAYERLLHYVTFMTPSDEDSTTSPSSECQFDLARELEKELKELGVSDTEVSEYCYVYGHIPASPGYESVTPIGFVAHMDTVSAHCDHPVAPVITENYDGGELALGESGRVLSPDMFPHLADLKGRTLITTDGTTILGADDKAGIAEIMTMVERLMAGDAAAESAADANENTDANADENNTNENAVSSAPIPHGPISIAFTPDEEIGRGTVNFDVAKLGARYAYTVDGDIEGGLEYETFNAASARVTVKGVDVHPGSAKDVMINASLVAMEYNALLPAGERPENTEGYEGFYHLTSMEGDVDHAVLTYIIRDHDRDSFENRMAVMVAAADTINKKYGPDTVTADIKLQYRNMAEVINQNPEVLDKVKAACASLGIEPVIKPVRGGTDGSNLSFMGLPCPNLGTGGEAYHGPYEHITVEGMDTCADILLAIVSEYAK